MPYAYDEYPLGCEDVDELGEGRETTPPSKEPLPPDPAADDNMFGE